MILVHSGFLGRDTSDNKKTQTASQRRIIFWSESKDVKLIKQSDAENLFSSSV